jgi:hypothetical protein
MGKTYRKGAISTHKKPKGRKKALINNARLGAVPPDPWDDKVIGRENYAPWRVAQKMIFQGKNENDIRKTLNKKFNLPLWQIEEILGLLLEKNKNKESIDD